MTTQDIGSARSPFVLLASGFFTAIFIDALQDVATWVHCFRSGGCTDVTLALRNVQYMALAVGSALAILAAALTAREREKPINEALLMIIGVFAAGLISLFEIAVGPAEYPLFDVFDVPLFIFVTLMCLVIPPLVAFRQQRRAVLIWWFYGRLAVAALLSGLGVLAVFGQGAEPRFLMAPGDTRHILMPYALVILPATWASVMATPFSRVTRKAFSGTGAINWWTVFGILTIVLSALYGVTPDMADKPFMLDTQSRALTSLFLLGSSVLLGVFVVRLGFGQSTRRPWIGILIGAVVLGALARFVVLPFTTTLADDALTFLSIQFALCCTLCGAVVRILDGAMVQLRRTLQGLRV